MGTLTHYQAQNIALFVIKGMSLREIAEMYDVPYKQVCQMFNIQKERHLRVPLFFSSKTDPYYTNEEDYGNLPTYTWEDLCDEEKKLLEKKEPDV
jgi:hypothetical protein